jgi:hypothetical protein
VGSYQGCSEALHDLAREAAKAKATAKWRQMGVRSVHEALGIYTHDVHRRCAGVGSVFWRSWARVIRGRLPVIGRLNADILHHGPPPAYAHGREAVGGAQATRRGRRCTPAQPRRYEPGVVRGARAAAGLWRRAAGWRVPAEPTMLRLNSHCGPPLPHTPPAFCFHFDALPPTKAVPWGDATCDRPYTYS